MKAKTGDLIGWLSGGSFVVFWPGHTSTTGVTLCRAASRCRRRTGTHHQDVGRLPTSGYILRLRDSLCTLGQQEKPQDECKNRKIEMNFLKIEEEKAHLCIFPSTNITQILRVHRDRQQVGNSLSLVR